MFSEVLRRGWKELEKRLLRVDIVVVVGGKAWSEEVESMVDVSWRLLYFKQWQVC